MTLPSVSAVSLALAALLACGGGDDRDAAPDAGDQAATDAAAAGPRAGAYRRVVPGYDTEAACREANPDFLFACVELMSLCADGDAYWLVTDIVLDGYWQDKDDGVVVEIIGIDGINGDNSVAFEPREDGSLYAAEIYGDRAFERATDPLEDLCP